MIHSSLVDLRKALKGLVVMSQALETMFNSIYNNTVPEMWASKVLCLRISGSVLYNIVAKYYYCYSWILYQLAGNPHKWKGDLLWYGVMCTCIYCYMQTSPVKAHNYVIMKFIERFMKNVE